MRRSLQDFAHSDYERPQCQWSCGLSADGDACPAGPTARGNCPALAECNPVRDGDRWVCNRSPIRGGPCEEGPDPDGICCRVNHCRPVRSLRSRRGRFVVLCAVSALGTMLMMLSTSWREDVLKPGPLAQNHAQILADMTGTQRCATCHEAADEGAANWLISAVWKSEHTRGQSERCLNCHQEISEMEFSLLAHNGAPEMLRQITSSRHSDGNPLVRNVAAGPANHNGEIACASCHREHHGAMHDLTAMTNNSCQVCHSERYLSFASDHPGFGTWPYRHRTRIVFDHASHSGKHFPKENAAFTCAKCHVDDPNQSSKMTVSYEQGCASCHDESIKVSVGKGIPILALPTMDTETLADAGFDIGSWPERASGDFDGAPPAFMKLLLAGDPNAAEAMDVLGADYDLIDVDPDDRAHLEAAAKLAAATKTLVDGLANDGRFAIANRLSHLRGGIDPDLLLAGLSTDSMREIKRNWFARKDDASKNTPVVERLEQRIPWRLAAAGNWTVDSKTYKLRYSPSGHADPMLTSWLTLLTENDATSGNPAVRAALRKLAKPTAAGTCTSCHSIDEKPNGNLAINWRAYDGSAAPREFTKFSHRPHLIQPHLTDCTHCHEIDPSASTGKPYTDWNSDSFVSDFLPISKGTCAACHTKTAAGDRCQSCHNYHIDTLSQEIRD